MDQFQNGPQPGFSLKTTRIFISNIMIFDPVVDYLPYTLVREGDLIQVHSTSCLIKLIKLVNVLL